MGETSTFSLSFGAGDGQKGNSANFADNLTNMSVSFWIKTTDAGATLSVIVGKIVTFGFNPGWAVSLTNGEIEFDILDASHENFFTTDSVADNVWHNVVVTKTGNILQGYVDGIVSGGATLDPTGSFSNSQVVSLGRAGDGSGQQLAALIDDMAIWNVALTISDAANIYAGGDLPATGLLAHWPFEEGTGLTTADTSGNSETMTLVENVDDTIWSTDVPPPLQPTGNAKKKASTFLVM